MNKFIAIGHISQDCDLKYTSKGSAVANFSLAVNSGFGDYQKTDFFRCVLFGKRAEGLSPYLVKGVQVAIEGEIHITSNTEKDKYYISVEVKELKMLGGKKDNSAANENNSDPFKDTVFDDNLGDPVDDGDLPF